MNRNLVFTDRFLYFISRKQHRLIRVELEPIFDKVRAGEQCPPDKEEGKVLGMAIVDFSIDDEGTVWALFEDSTVEKLGTESPLCRPSLQAYKIQDKQTGKVDSTAVGVSRPYVVAALYSGSQRSIIYALLNKSLALKHLYNQILEEPDASCHKILMVKKRGFTFVVGLRYRNRIDFMIIGKGHLYPVQNSKWIGGGDEGPNHGMVWGKEGEELLVFGEKSIRSVKLTI